MLDVRTKTYASLPPFDEGEILRYAGARGCADEGLFALMRECIKECEPQLRYRVCYTELADFQSLIGDSKSLAAALRGAKKALLFAATVGLGVDRLIARYAEVSPVKALFFQAIGAERIEALCEAFCRSYEGYEGLFPLRRFSAGYGDCPLERQKTFFEILDPTKRIGLTLTDGLMMSPTKSVTAIFGLAPEKEGV